MIFIHTNVMMETKFLEMVVASFAQLNKDTFVTKLEAQVFLEVN